MMVMMTMMMMITYVFKKAGFGKTPTDLRMHSHSYLKHWLLSIREGNALAPSRHMELQVSVTFMQHMNYRCDCIDHLYR